MAKKAKLLEQLGKNIKNIQINDDNFNVEEIDVEVLKEIKEKLRETITDYREDISYHPLENSIMITFLGLMANCNEWTEIREFAVLHHEWFKLFLDLTYDIPSLSTIKRCISVVDPSELEEVCIEMIINKITQLQELLDVKTEGKEIVAYDGKVCRGSKREETKDGKVKPLNAMTAFNVTKDISLGTKFIEDKTNEIPTGPELIKHLDLTNTISTFDALNTQEEIIKAIVEKGGDYVGALKGNQHSTFDDVVSYFSDDKLYNYAYNKCHYEETEKLHNQIEKRTYIMNDDIDYLNKDKWKNLKSVGICKKEVIKNDVKQVEIRYYITSLELKCLNDFKRAVREEWGIENNLHWHLDVTFKEDANTTMNKNAQANLNILRKLCLNILKLVKPMYNKSLKLIRFRIGQNFEEEIINIFRCLNINKLKEITQKTK